MKPKIALVYDKLNTEYGGAEHVLKALLELFPDAPLYTSIHLPNMTPWINPQRVRSSWLNTIPWLKHHFTLCAPVLPLAFESFDFSKFDTVISITSGEAKGILTTPAQRHICYLLTPPRYLYSHKDEYKKGFALAKLPLFSQLFDLLRNYQTLWDQVAVHRPDVIIPISEKVARRVENYYTIKTDQIIYPPMPDQPSFPDENPTHWPDFEYLLSASRLVSYKRIDLAISACIQSKKKLVVVGDGPEKTELIMLAGKHGQPIDERGEPLATIMSEFAQSDRLILFLGKKSETEVYALMRECKAFILPGIEDFGIAPLQAASYGKPVIIHRESGVAEILSEPIHGVHIEKEDTQDIVKAIDTIFSINYNHKTIKSSTLKYEKKAFKKKFIGRLAQLTENLC